MSTQLTVRPLISEDVTSVATLLNTLYRDEGSVSQPGISAEDILRMLQSNQPRIKAIVAQSGEKVVGCLIYYQGFDVQSMTHGVHVADMVVLTEARRQHVGTSLLQYLAANQAACGGAWMSLTCLKENQAGNKFYRALGFNEISVQFYAIGVQGMKKLCANNKNYTT